MWPVLTIGCAGAEHYIDFTKTKDIQAEVMKITGFGAHGEETKLQLITFLTIYPGVLVTAATKAAYDMAPVSIFIVDGTIF